MKKKHLIFFLSLIIISNPVNAKEEYKDITNDVEVRYKWYKEKIIDGEYYPLRKITNKDRYDKNDYKYINPNRVNKEFCDYSEEFYKIERITYRTYNKVYDANYVVIENIEPNTNVKIYYNNLDLSYKVISHDNNILILDLKKEWLCDKLLFYIDTDNKYKISLYRDEELQKLIMSKNLVTEKTIVPRSDWSVEPNAYYETYITLIEYDETSLTKINQEKILCRASEKYVYKYDIQKEYYDDSYHTYIEGYIKDENDYRYYYKGEPIVINNTIEVIKEQIKEVPILKYVYLEKEKSDEETKKCQKEIQTKVETNIIKKEIIKIPKKIYILIICLFTIITIFIIREIVKKCRLN